MLVPEAYLRRLVSGLLQNRGAPAEAARLQADVLIEAEPRGLPSHGLMRLARLDASDPANKGDVLILIDPGRDDAMTMRLTADLDELRTSRPANPNRGLAIPGHGMRERQQAALYAGIDLPDALPVELRALQAA
jgi:LDH2 family malate/lactate/ureidoglycolate dehydrogenase